MHRTYGGGTESVMDMDVEDGLDMIAKAMEKENESKLWDLYMAVRPHMTEENYKSWDEFRGVVVNPQTNKENNSKIKTKDDIYADVAMIRKAQNKSKGMHAQVGTQ